ncbi:Transposase and inactivated derivatives [Chitinophaga sp. YR627]|uniref:hypothetical protein n=1 Tax=Chitinophaga sp. YR627 TaxID=1881041 RepID=UPI0008E108C2|nr:hypothetical protein [Chitinophaga sp. YR627]SFP14238.1 Transposase and inactivated derivatives [Chitinophaga sp. YR627]
MKRKSPGPPPTYSESLKITIAHEYLTGDQGYGQLAKKYDLRGADVVRGMVSWYKKHYNQEQLPPVKQAAVAMSTPAKEVADTEKDKQLKEALLKVEALELLISNAGKELGVDLIKKLGTKQPGK